MENYQSMAKSIERLKRPLIYIALISAVTHLLILGTGIYLNREKADHMSAFEVCHKGMKGLFGNLPNHELFNKTVLKDVKDKTFEVESLSLIKMFGDYNCDVVAKDHKGHRSYRVRLEKNPKFTHLYRIIDVKGQRLASPYQWKEKL